MMLYHFIYEETEHQKAPEQPKNLNTPIERTIVVSNLTVFFGEYFSILILRLRLIPHSLVRVCPTLQSLNNSYLLD